MCVSLTGNRDMSKYAPLGDYLRAQIANQVPMTFSEVERVIGTKLPPNAPKYPAWWSNNPTNNVMTKVWLDAGFRTEQVDISARRLVFRRVRSGANAATITPTTPSSDGSRERHPLRGALKGFVRIMPGTDITKPLDADWES
jgi:hypothetical protein